MTHPTTITAQPDLTQALLMKEELRRHFDLIGSMLNWSPGLFTVVFVDDDERTAVSLHMGTAWESWEVHPMTADRVTDVESIEDNGVTIVVLTKESTGSDRWFYSNASLRLQEVCVEDGLPRFLYNETANEVLAFVKA